MRVTGLLLSVLLSVCVGSLNAETIYVPGDQPTIQAGIDDAVNGDTVLVADGTYTGVGNHDIDFLGKAIVVMSENGAENCIVDCEEAGQGFRFDSGEGSSSLLQGFTIRNGTAEYGGGIYCSGSSPTITGNKISSNTAHYCGGGIGCVQNSSPNITGNTITGNTSTGTGWGGGGIYSYLSSPTVTDNTISGNTADWAAGIYCHTSEMTITGNMIENNTTRSGACGGFLTGWSDVIITGNTITGNLSGTESPNGPGGFSCQFGTSIIEDNVISGNMATGGAGGILLWEEISTISNNLIMNNSADSIGAGGIAFIAGSSARLYNNTIAGNSVNGEGGGVWLADNNTVNMVNTIFWNNSATTGDEISISYYESSIPSTLTITYSDVEGGEEGVFVDEGCTLNWGDGMIDADPMFVHPDKNDCRLLWESPCIDTGHPDSLDADGTRSDIGAYFFDQDDFLTLYITPDMTEVAPGEVLGVTYTAINRWAQPESFWCLSQVLLPGGAALNVLGPDQYTLPASQTAQVHVNHPVPPATPAGVYEYWSRIGVLPPELYDEDSFTITVSE